MGLTALALIANLSLKPKNPQLEMPHLERLSDSPLITKATYKDRDEYYFKFFNIQSNDDTLNVYVVKDKDIKYEIKYVSKFSVFNSNDKRTLSGFRSCIQSTIDNIINN